MIIPGYQLMTTEERWWRPWISTVDQAATRTELRGRNVAELRREVRGDIAELRSDLHALTERVARVEGSFSGPWRCAGERTPAPSAPLEETA